MGWFKNMIKNWLEIRPALGKSVLIHEPFTFEAEIFRNKLWYRGDPSELSQFYAQIDDYNGNTSFWQSKSSYGIDFRKMHSGLPALIVDTLSDIVCNDLIDIDTGSFDSKAVWDAVAEDNNFKKLLKKAVRAALSEGDGAFKISYDPDISMYPIIEFYGAAETEFIFKRGRIDQVIFKSTFMYKNKTYTLKEFYAKKSISYKLFDQQGNEEPLSKIPQTEGLKDVSNDASFLMAIPLMFDENLKHQGRGRSIFDSKIGAFDALDEVISQWIDAIRAARAVKYIPEIFLPKDPESGATLRPNPFDNRYIKTESDLRESGSTNKIELIQGTIDTQAFSDSYNSYLDTCLQGIISPSTLGIDVKKLDNAEAQREKEKATLYTRNRLIEVLQDVLPRLADAVLKTYDMLRLKTPGKYDVSVEFGEYANPSFEAQVETVGKAKQYGIMSIETVVNELYGDVWTEDEKNAEIERLKSEQGINAPEDEDPITDTLFDESGGVIG